MKIGLVKFAIDAMSYIKFYPHSPYFFYDFHREKLSYRNYCVIVRFKINLCLYFAHLSSGLGKDLLIFHGIVLIILVFCASWYSEGRTLLVSLKNLYLLLRHNTLQYFVRAS